MLYVGRMGYDVELDDPISTSFNGRGLELTGEILAGSVNESVGIREQMRGMVNNRFEPTVPIHSSEDPSINGWYRIKSADVGSVPVSLATGLWPFRLSAEMVPGKVVEAQMLGTVRANVHGYVLSSLDPWHAVPDAAVAYDRDGDFTTAYTTRTGPGGTVKIRVPPSQLMMTANPTWRLPVENWYDMASTIRCNGSIVVGNQMVDDPLDWELTNGLIDISSNPGVSLLRMRFPDSGSLGDWSTVNYDIGFGAYNVFLGSDLIGPIDASAVSVLRNSPEECIVRLYLALDGISGAAGTGASFLVDVGLRRGSRYITCQFSSRVVTGAGFGVQPTNALAVTSTTDGWTATSFDADGNKLFVRTGTAKIQDLATGRINNSALAATWDACIGAQIGAGTGIESAASVGNQYFAAQVEQQHVREP